MKFQQLPEPHHTVAGRNHREPGGFSWRNLARLWRPTGVIEPEVSTLARFAGRLIDRVTGKAYSSDELVKTDTKEIIFVTVGDSIMHEDAADISTHGFWMHELTKSERYSGATTVDLAANSKTLAAVDADITASLAPYANQSAQTKLIVFIGTGINDLAGGATGSATHITLLSIVAKVRAAGGYPVVFGSPYAASYQAEIWAFNALCRQSVIDGDFDALVDLIRLNYPTYDGLHHTKEGAVTIGAEVRAVLRGDPLPTGASFNLPLTTALTITAISEAAAAQVTSAGHGLATGDFVKISSSNSTPAIDGIWEVTVVDANNFTIPFTTTDPGTSGSINKGVARIAADIPYAEQTTWLIHTFQAGGGSAETFFATNLFAYPNQVALALTSIAYLSGGVGSSPIFSGGATLQSNLVDCFIVNNSAWAYSISIKQVGKFQN